MIIVFLLVAQAGGISLSYYLTKKPFSYLVITNLILFLCLIGSLLNEVEIYKTHEASTYLVGFSFLLNLGASCQNVLTGRKLKRAMCYIRNGKPPILLVNELNRTVIIFALLFFFTLALYFFKKYGVPLFFDDLKYARRDIQEDTHIFYRVFLYALPISSGLLYARYKIYQSKRDKNLFLLSFCLTAIILFALGYKGFVLWYSVFILMLINVYSNDILGYGLALGVVALFAGIVATVLMYSFTVMEALDLLLGRATQIAAYGYNIVFYELYPQLGYVILGDISLNQFLAEWKFGIESQMSVNSMGITTTVVGTLLVYLGKTGALLSAVLLGFVMQYAYFLTFKYMVSPLFAVFYLYLTFIFVGLVPRGTLQNVFTQPVLTLFLLTVSYIAAEVILKANGRYRFNKVKC